MRQTPLQALNPLDRRGPTVVPGLLIEPAMAPPVSGSAPRTPNTLAMRDVDSTPVSKPPPLPVVDGKISDPDTFDSKPKATTFNANGGVQHTDGRLSARARHDQLPEDLRSKIDPKLWKALPEGQRATLVASYQKFKRAGVWDEVTKVTGEKEVREPKVRLPGGYETSVPGNSGTIQYEIKNKKQFIDKLLAQNPNFGVDQGKMGALHPGQTSIREFAQQGSFHISVGPGNKMDAHIDVENPVNHPKNGRTQTNVRKGIEHWSHEVLPEKIRDHVGVPGVVIEPSVTPGSRDEKPEGKVMVNLEFRGISKRKPRVENAPMEGSQSVPAKVMEKLAANKKLTDIKFPRPKGVEAGAAPDPKELAASIAAKMKEALEKGESRINVDIPSYAGQPGYQKAATGATARIAKLVKAELEAAGVDTSGLTAVTVTYGKRNAKDKFATEGETVSL